MTKNNSGGPNHNRRQRPGGQVITLTRVICVLIMLASGFVVLRATRIEPLTLRLVLVAALAANLFSVALAVFAVDILNERRTLRTRRRAIILQMGSPSNSLAIEAVRVAREEGWLWDGSLRGAGLVKAHLKDADCQGADLRGADLREADLRGASLENSDFQGANLAGVDFRDAHFGSAGLSSANLLDACLQDAIYFEDADFDTMTTLPDGSHWEPGADVTRFSNTHHPHFWQPADPDAFDQRRRKNDGK